MSVVKMIETFAGRIRHKSLLSNAEGIWDIARPLYDKMLRVLAYRGLTRVMNGTDSILVLPELRSVQDCYEPLVWGSIMQEVKPGDVIVDIGAYVGLYTIAFSKRTGPRGRVIAFEPNSMSYRLLERQVRLNQVGANTTIVNVALSNHEGESSFRVHGCESSLMAQGMEAGAADRVICRTLDGVFEDSVVDIVKIDVEGFEELVLRGGRQLLSDESRCPRTIFVEVHPYAWPGLGLTDSSLLSCLHSSGYQVMDLASHEVKNIRDYGEIVATRQTIRRS